MAGSPAPADPAAGEAALKQHRFTSLALFGLLEAQVAQLVGRPFDLDPCGHVDAPVTRCIRERGGQVYCGSGGLEAAWNDKVVFANEPFDDIEAWVKKVWASRARFVLLLTPAWTDRAWWLRWIEPFRDAPGSPLRVRFTPRFGFGTPEAPDVDAASKWASQLEYGMAFLLWDAAVQPLAALPSVARLSVEAAAGQSRGAERAARVMVLPLPAGTPLPTAVEPVSSPSFPNEPAPAQEVVPMAQPTAKFPHVVYVESNVKGGVACRLGPKTLIVGETGSGKSGVVNAVELALSGRVSDLVGRDTVAAAAELQALSPTRSGVVHSRAVLEDGTEFLWSLGGKTKKPEHTRPMSFQPEKAFPLRAVREAVLGSPDTTRKFFLTLTAGHITDSDVVERIPAQLHGHWRKAITASKSTAPVDKLLTAQAEAGRLGRLEKGQAEAAEELVKSLTAGLALTSAPTDDAHQAAAGALAEARRRVEEAVRALAVAETTQSYASSAEVARRQLAELEARRTVLRAQQAEVDAKLVGLREAASKTSAPPRLTELQQAVALVVAETATQALAVGHPVACTACRGMVSHDEAAARHELVKGKIAERARLSEDRTTLEGRIAKGEGITKRCAVELTQVEHAIAQVTSALPARAEPQDTAPLITALAAARAVQHEAERVLRGLEGARSSWNAITQARTTAVEARDNLNRWDQLQTACETAIGELLDGGVKGFVECVQRFLPVGYVFDLRLRDGKREVCQHGFTATPQRARQDGVLYTALSGAEWAIEQAALAAVVAEHDAVVQVQVVVPEDRGLSTATLDAVLSAFSRLPCQVLITTPTRPAKVPAGWTVLDTDVGAHKAGAPQFIKAVERGDETDIAREA